MHTAAFADCPTKEWTRVFDIHFRGTVEVLRAAWPHLLRSGSGRIITTASSGMLGNAGITAYGAAKAAIFGFTRSIAWEGVEAGITANCILPDRKSVVWGQRVSVRVDLGGLRILQKKKKRQRKQ